MSSGAFRNEIARARTFGFMRDVETLWKAGLALGASLNNTIALADDRIMNAEGLRYPEEFVRHKMLDAVGDLALAGGPVLGAYRSVRGGHRLNARVVQALLADRQMTLRLTPAASERLAAEGYDREFGARPLKRVLQRKVQDPLARRVLAGEFGPGNTVVVDVTPEGEIFFTKSKLEAGVEAAAP